MKTSWDFPYTSQRMPVLADQAVATSQPLAAQAGLDILSRGGNAVDAAIATAAALTVVEPTSNGLGGDAFAMVFENGQLHGINGSGRAPAALQVSQFSLLKAMPQLGWASVTVPGAVSVWAALWQRFGRLDFALLLERAILYAREGFTVSPITAQAWQKAQSRYQAFAEFRRTFLPGGNAPVAGSRFHNRDQAETLAQIAESKGESFYRGDLAGNICDAAARDHAQLALTDLQSHQPQWVPALAMDYYGVRLHELPPNGQGIAALLALGVLRELAIERFAVDSVDALHLQIEAMKLGFAAAGEHVADPDHMVVDAAALLNPSRLQRLAESVDPQHARYPKGGVEPDHGTVYLCTADSEGMMVSMIQSNYMGFGSGVVIPGTGIAMQNRACGFNLEPGHPNEAGGGKRPFHTIIPAFVTRGGEALMSLGVMGGRMQPQGHVQMMVRIFNGGQNPQAASDAPRWCLLENGNVAVERHMPASLVQGLLQRGHRVYRDSDSGLFGGAQCIMKLDGGGYLAASDHRKDGCAVGF